MINSMPIPALFLGEASKYPGGQAPATEADPPAEQPSTTAL